MGRRLGQHFLSDPAILDRIVDAINPQPDDVVLEIGPGRGTLTARLAPRVGQVVAIEKDEALASAAVTFPNVRVVQGDALEVDWWDLIRNASTEHRAPRTAKVIGNIPYYITSPLIEKALTPPLPSVVVMLIQREVAERLAASPGSKTYGALTVGVQAVAQVERLFTVRAGAFSPPPKVDSAVVRLTPLAEPMISPAEHRAFREFNAALFSQRRKQIGRSLRSVWGTEKERVASRLGDLGIDPTSRAEVLAPDKLVTLFRSGRSLTET